MASLLGQVLAALLGGAGAPQRRQRPSINYWPLWVGALLLAGLALIFFVLAGFFALTEPLGAPAAAALTAAILLVLAAILVAFAMLLRPPPAPPPEPDLVAVLLERLGEGVGAQIAAKQPALTIAVALAGVALGYSPTLRRWLLSLVK